MFYSFNELYDALKMYNTVSTFETVKKQNAGNLMSSTPAGFATNIKSELDEIHYQSEERNSVI